MTRERFKAMMSIAGLAILFGIPVEMYFNHRTPRPEPTHIEADNLRYLDPSQFKAAGCEADGVTWPPRADGGCYAADKPGIHDNHFSDNTISGDVNGAEGGAYVYDGKKWRRVPTIQGDCTILKSGAMECCGGPGHPPCDNGPGPIQGQWMAERGDHCTINGYTDVLCDNPCDTTGISLKEWETYSCTVDAGNGHISSGTLSPPHAGPTYGQWLTPEQMRAVPPPADEQSSGTVNYSDGGDFMYCKKQGDHWHCEPFYPPAVLKGPPTQVCVYDFVGSPYLRLNKAVSDPSCADFDSPPPAVINVPGDCLQYDATNNVFEACPPPDDNSEELEQDDYNNEITEGRHL